MTTVYYATDDSPESLGKYVNRLVRQGWESVGAPVIWDHALIQMMKRFDPPPGFANAEGASVRDASAEEMMRQRDEARRLAHQYRSDLQKARAELELRRNKDNGQYWCWMGEGDHLESLTCPVLIPAKELRRLSQAQSILKVDRLLDALNKLACLGNGDQFGNSTGNVIAQDAIAEWHSK